MRASQNAPASWTYCSWLVALVAGLSILACGGPVPETKPNALEFMDHNFPRLLSRWGLFDGPLKQLKPAKGVLPYGVNSSLFTDYAVKRRWIWMPAHRSAHFDSTGALVFPLGTLLIKHFTLPQKKGVYVIETRMLLKAPQGWVGLPYVWNEAQNEAIYTPEGSVVQVQRLLPSGEKQPLSYATPNMGECRSCHQGSGEMKPLSAYEGQLNRPFTYDGKSQGQLEKWRELGLLESGLGVPDKHPRWDDPSVELSQRARMYLHVNCAHCHQPKGIASFTRLDLRWSKTRDCGALQHPSLNPGRPEASSLLKRLASSDPALRMPMLGRNLVHKEGVLLIQRWIQKMDADCPKN